MVEMGRTIAEGCVQRKAASEASPVGEDHRGRGRHCDLVDLPGAHWEAFLVVGDWGDRGDVVVEAQWENLAAVDLWVAPWNRVLHSGS
jgi:hypothetical protein